MAEIIHPAESQDPQAEEIKALRRELNEARNALAKALERLEKRVDKLDGGRKT